MNRSDLQKLIESCRGEADLQLPELRPLADAIATDPAVQSRWEKSQQMDAEFRQAMRDVPIPTGLEGRLLAGLHLSQPEAGPEVEPPTLVDSAAESMDSSVELPRRTSRWRVWTAALVGVAAIVLIALFASPEAEPQLVTEEQAREQAVAWIGQLSDSKWQSSSAPEQFVLPTQIKMRPRWQAVSTGSRSLHVVCYDLASAGSRAFLFVTRSQQPTSLPTAPPARPYPKGPWHIAAWKPDGNKGGLIYLLAVENGSKQYQNLIRGPSSIAARLFHRKSSPAGKV